MDFYQEPVPNTYALSRFKWFDIPTDENGATARVIAVTARESQFWLVAYTIIVTLIFAAVSRLAVDLVLAYYTINGSGNRLIMLIAFYNANNPASAASLMADYCRRALFNTTKGGARKANWSALRGALILMAVAGVLIGSNTAAKFTVSGSRLIKRHAARASPSAIFYPDVESLFYLAHNRPDLIASPAMYSTLKTVRASAGFQALGRYETSRRRLSEVVKVESTRFSDSNGNLMAQFNYSYGLTGYEMGLQNAAALRIGVSGFCETNYAIIQEQNDTDFYNYWDNPLLLDGVNPSLEEITAPYVNMVDGGQDVDENDVYENTTLGYKIGLTPHTAYRITNNTGAGNDPWYSTENNTAYNRSLPQYLFGGVNRVKRARPALTCYQNDTYTLGGHTVHHVDELKYLPGLKLSTLLRDTVFPFEFATPPMVFLGNNLGYNALGSSQFFNPANKLFDVEFANMTDDFTKLVSLSYLYSREVARNLPLLYSALSLGNLNIPNAAEENGTVPYDYADIILDSTGVAAMSVVVLIVTPVICVLVWLVVLFRRSAFGLRPKADVGQDTGPARMNLRAVGLQATQLYRFLEEQDGKHSNWSGRQSMTPYIKEIERDMPVRSDRERQDADHPFVLPTLVPIDDPPAANEKSAALTTVTSRGSEKKYDLAMRRKSTLGTPSAPQT
jgi:uncharacterized protein YqgC (DUF456 family)